ncbi:protein eyes shut homolog [Canis lupus dingo]|uniref:protein eyes shut homolog n=1 Tax=Canis lupus dingo TaxID=286419 RepID=UPI000DC690A0|nr:protein eyes shut homolog [Canis lupus dingo]
MTDYKIQLPKMINKSIMLLSLVVLHSTFINGKTTCKWQFVEEWHTQPLSYVVNWTLTGNICMDFYGDCWFGDVNTKMNTSGNQVVPQICPLQIQLGDILVISSEPSLQSPEINLMNVSKASFIDCLQNTTTEDQLLFGCKLKGMHTVNSQWLSVGTHYFITVTASGPSLCHLGLRLNVTVKEQFCQESLSSEFCSGHGKCLTEVWSKTYNCHCQPPFSGKYCQELDACFYKPCENNGICINKRGKWNKQGYECICHQPFTGINCSEIIDQCQSHICFHGNYGNITTNNFICECDEPFSGSFCEETMESYVSQSCWKVEIWRNKSPAYICECPKGFFHQNCETNVNECSLKPCQNDADCIHVPNGTMYICSAIFTGKLCKRQLQTPRESFPHKKNTTCMKYENDYHCSCLPGFAGKNCEKVIDHCRLLSINCLNEEWCFSISGGFRYVCTLEYTKYSCWFLKNVCLIHLYPCYCGTISHICQANAYHHLQFKYVWQLGFKGSEDEKCEVAVDSYLFLSANCTESAIYVNTSEDLDYICWFLFEGTIEMCAKECSCLSEEDNKRYWCRCIPRWLGKMSLENTTDYEESGCQHEVLYKDEINKSRCSISFVYMDRFYMLSVEDCLENQNTSVYGLCFVHLHNCNCSCLQIYERNICEIETEDCKSVPCKNEATSIYLSGYFFCKCLPGFTGSRCEIDGDLCVSHPCKNGATCIDQPGNYFCHCVAPFKVVNGFSCLCNPGFAGLRCEQDIDDCILNACEHNSTCKDLHLSYQCVCLTGWEGSFCEQESNDCKMNPCKNNSTCTDLYNSYHCECTSGWTGQNCSEETNECDSDPCMNGALCHESTIPGQFVCLCPPFYTGKFCHQHYNPCDPLSDPCRNNSTCLTLVDGTHFCVCREGFQGEHCAINVNECFSLPCQNDGDCEDGFNNFRCICRPGFSGPLCELETNDCSSGPCKNNGTCVGLTSRFMCNCETVYPGSLCELDMRECEISPCLDGEDCVSRIVGYNCLCAPGYTGIDCEVNIDECLSEPCLQDGTCIDGINHYTCDCKSGFFGTHCETNANDCLSNPCLHGRCIDLVSKYQCSCVAEWTTSRCKIKINNCTSIPCINEDFCQKSVHGFTCICPSGYTDAYCEINIDSAEPELSLILCLNGTICVDGPGHLFYCRCVPGFSGQFCKIYINECSSSLCLKGAKCEDHINGYICKCQQGWSRLHCESELEKCISNLCVHGICIENEPGFGSTCLCISGFVTCSTGLFCGDERGRITHLPPISQRTDVISTQTHTVPASDTSISSFPSARATRLWTIMNTYPIDPGPKQTGIIKHDVLPTTGLAALSIGISFESYSLEELISTRELSAKYGLLSSTDVPSSQFLNFGVHDPAQTDWGKTSISHMPFQTSAAITGFLFPSRGERTPFIISPFMTDAIYPTESLLFENNQTIALSTTAMSSVITGIPGADIKLNRHSLLPRGFLLTTASTSVPPVVSRGAQEDIEEYSAVSLISRREYWRLLSSSMSPISPAKIIISKQVAILNSSTLHQFTTQTSIPSEYQVITEASSNQRLTNIKSQAADSLSELSQTCATCSMTEIKSSHEFSDQVLHSKQSHFYETFWMNSAILASWYALMGIQTITSGHSFSSATEITPSAAFTELSSLFLSKKSTKIRILSSSLEESITLSSNLDVNLCLDKTYLSIVPSQTVSSDPMNTDLTSKLTIDDPFVSENILKLLTMGHYDVTVGPTEILSQDNLLGVQESKGSHQQSKLYTRDSSLDFELNLQKHPETIPSNDFDNNMPPYMYSMSDFSEVTSDIAFYAVSATQSLPIQASFPVSVLMPDWTYSTDYLTLTSDLKEGLRTSSEWSKWELQPSVHDWEFPATTQRLSITRSLTLSSLEFIPLQLTISDFNCACYYGDSYLEFQKVLLNPQNSISLEFQTFNSYGLLLYLKQDSDSVDGFLIQLFIGNGTLQYYFFCAGEAKLRSINTTIKVDDGQKYTLLIRQEFDPCRAELTILGRTVKSSESMNHVSGKPLPESGSVFIGGFPYLHGAIQISGPVENFTGCIKVIEINNLESFIPSKAVKKIHVDNCRSQDSTLSTLSSVAPSGVTEGVDSIWTSLGSPLVAPSMCQEDMCHNGGTCHPVLPSSGIFSYQCDCPLHFTGRFCEQDAGLFFPSFNGNSYLELPFFTTLDEFKFVLEKEHNRTVTIYLTIKTNTLNGTILYSNEKNIGQHFIHLFLVEGRPMVKYGCGSSQNILTLSANYSINTNVFIPITVRYTIPVGSPRIACMIEMTADGKPPIQKEDTEISYVSQVHFESMFLGHIPANVKIYKNAGQIYGFKGCIQELQVNNKEFFIIDEALRGKNIENCHVPWCAHHLCHNNGTCISDNGNWFCECPRLYSGKMCQYATCENNPCGNGATCVPKSRTDIVCLCPYGRSGLLCKDAINITEPRFSGTDAFGYTSFLAYSRIPDISFGYEFHLKFQLANNHSALQNNLIFFTGQKGHGLNGDDFLAVGLRNGSVIYTYNLGSGMASISSDPLDLSLGIHSVRLGRLLQMGWLKVDDHKNKSIISPGRLVGLNVVSQFYVGGYSEYIPDLLPNGADFKNGFQGCIFTMQVRTEKKDHFRGLGNPEGHPNAGRSVSQCDASPCSLMKCANGGMCIETGFTVYCDCPTGWKGEFCTEAVSTCDPEHDPPHHCSRGATCVPLLHGYTCYCPLGTTGIYCEQALSISDPSFRSHELSWMSFASFRIRKNTHIQLQFQPLSEDGILFYVAQHLKAQSGDFLCISLVNGFVQLRYNLGDRTIILETLQKVTTNGSTWHVIKAGRVGAEGYLDLDGINVTEKANAKMSSLDTNTDFYIGGVSSLNLVNPMSIANEPSGFQGCVREVIINNQELQLTELGAKGGSNVGDCDGTPCGYNVCRNGGECIVNGTTFSCRCLPHWTGNTCDQSVYCWNNLCLHQSLCIPDQFSYSCLCALGWVGKYCENKTSFSTAKFMGNSYIKYIDPDYRRRNLQFTTVSLNFSTTETEGLIVWIGKAQNEENDFLAIGLHNQSLKIAVNLGESISVHMTYSNGTFHCNKWHHVRVIQNQTLIKAYLDDNLILSEDIDPHKKFVALNYDGISYLGGFEYGQKLNKVTHEIFKKDFVGRIKDVFFQDSKKIELIKSEGYNVFNGDEQN